MFKRMLIIPGGEAATRVARACRRLQVHAIGLSHGEDPPAIHVAACDSIVETDGTKLAPEALATLAKEHEADAVFLGYETWTSDAPAVAALERLDIVAVGAADELPGPEELRRRGEDSGVRFSTGEEAAQHAHALSRARMVRVLVAADMHGRIQPLCESDRSLADRFWIEESPSPDLSSRNEGEATRSAMFEAAATLVTTIGASGLVSVDFLLTPDLQLFVQDVRIGLPRSHAVFETVVRIDLVALMIRIAAGERLPKELATVQPRGHSFATAIYLAEADDRRTAHFTVPPAPQGRLRAVPAIGTDLHRDVDSIPVAMKLCVHEPIRHRALLTLDRVLAETRATEGASNIEILRKVLADLRYRAGYYDRAFQPR